MRSENISFIILSAGEGRRTKSFGNRSLLEVSRGVNIAQYQIEKIRDSYPKSEIIFVVGYEADRLIKVLPPGIKIVENELFSTTNVVRSINIGLRVINESAAVIIHGDILFNRECISKIHKQASCVLADADNQLDQSKIGVNAIGDKVIGFTFSAQPKWAQISLLRGPELEIAREITAKRENDLLLSHELYGKILDLGGSFTLVNSNNSKIREINTIKDLKYAREYLDD